MAGGDPISVALPNDPNKMTGDRLYDTHCASCHQGRGQGSFDSGLPSLLHNKATGRTHTNNLAMVIFDGIRWLVDHFAGSNRGGRSTRKVRFRPTTAGRLLQVHATKQPFETSSSHWWGCPSPMAAIDD